MLIFEKNHGKKKKKKKKKKKTQGDKNQPPPTNEGWNPDSKNLVDSVTTLYYSHIPSSIVQGKTIAELNAKVAEMVSEVDVLRSNGAIASDVAVSSAWCSKIKSFF